MTNTFRTVSLVMAAAIGLLLVGCSTNENPISPQKMQEIRKAEGDQRANFNPNMNAPKGN